MSKMERNKGVLIPCSKEEVMSKYPSCDLNEIQYDTNKDYMRIKDNYFRLQWEVCGDSSSEGFCDVQQDQRGFIHFHSYHHSGVGDLDGLLEYFLTAATINNEEVKGEVQECQDNKE